MAENGLLTGFKMRWTMDEITSADLLYDAGNAKPGSEIWKKLAAEVMANVLGQHYFSELWHNGQRVKFDNRPDGYGLERSGHQAVLTFTLPLAKPQPLAGQTFTFSTYDPTYYVDMYYDKDADFALPAAMKTICAAKVMTPKPNEKMLSYAQSLDKADAPPEDMELGNYFAQKVTLQCR
ncbi:periplasmic or exported protein [Klebsiella oxytoca]|nr:periplasmic or exported protein [Klebsiella oxytoca]